MSSRNPGDRRRELDFERSDERTGRIGDPRPQKEIREEFPGRREREAGMTAGEVSGREVAADDSSPETLLDYEPSRTPGSMRSGKPADRTTRIVQAADIGIGGGLDEAEMAERDPVGRTAARALQQKLRAHAADPNRVEPHEAQARADTRRRLARREGTAAK